MGKVIFYEDRNFQGQHYECSSDCADLSPYFSRCNSIRVEILRRSLRMRIYKRPDFGGQMKEVVDVYDHFRYCDIHSCHVMDGCWIFYEHPNYRG
ncbi:gamma-crystallin M2-like [Rhincodon typus]|uniref:gamma-crystallin M2-like n=1 Tax=Rhincodon typus TaxID=259920 RepID=UPI0020300C2D|nr:gamma-crystallin M2-like [Rhincodon typus]